MLANAVTPCTGVWIEIDSSVPLSPVGSRHSLHGSVDWNPCPPKAFNASWVTPCTGVWIEIYTGIARSSSNYVTPCTGVWIEIYLKVQISIDKYRHSLHGSVDWNLSLFVLLTAQCIVTPCTGVWIEIFNKIIIFSGKGGHSLHGSVDWNSFIICYTRYNTVSLPARECGLK